MKAEGLDELSRVQAKLSKNKELLDMTDGIVSSAPVSRVYLFGSYAYGQPRSDSDYDLYVVIPDGSQRPIDAMQKFRRVILPYQTRAVDILVGTESQFAQQCCHQALEREVAEKGVLLYERA